MLLRLALVISLGAASVGSATQIVIDYAHAGDFFSPSTTDGQKARGTVEAAAAFYSTILEDKLAAITVPEPYVGATNGTTTTWTWDAIYRDPSGTETLSLTDPSFAEDEFRIYVGAQPLAGPTSAIGGSGGFILSDSVVGVGYTQSEFIEAIQIGGTFEDTVMHRGQGANDYAIWGGSVGFDSTITWNFDHTVEPVTGQNDLYSVAIHEFAHTLGIGGSDEWESFVSPAFFLGEQATAANGGTNPGLDPSGVHFAEGTSSTVYSGTAIQEASLDPTLTLGTRKRLTELDAAALRDIGWQVVQAVIPEPATLGLACLTVLSAVGVRRR